MQLRLPLVLLLAATATPALADCDVGLSTAGMLKLSTSDSHVLTSEEGTASVVIVTNLSGILGTTVTISNPRLDTYPAAFAAGSVTVEENYSATWLLGSSSNATYTSGSRNFAIGIGAVVTLTLNNRVTSSGGFKQGGYTTKTTISCS